VAVNYRFAEAEAAAVVAEIEAGGGQAVALRADMSILEEARSLPARAEHELGRIDIVVNNAGVTRDRLLLQMTADDWDTTWLTNLVGSRAVAVGALELMTPRKEGRIINVSSVVGSTGNAGQANYAAAKSAVLGLTRQLAIEAAPLGISVNCVVPGYITTDATAHLTPEQRNAWLDRIPMRRSAGPQEVAELITFLAVADVAYVTGQCIAVDGGLLAAAGKGLC